MNHEEWFAQATDDFKAANLLLREGHYSQAIWLAEQSAEKAHKSLFFALGLRTGDKALKTYGHFVDEVAEELPEFFGSGATIAKLLEISELGHKCRYPQKATADDGSDLGFRAPCRHPTFDQPTAAHVVAIASDVLTWAAERARWAKLGLAAMKAAAGAP